MVVVVVVVIADAAAVVAAAVLADVVMSHLFQQQQLFIHQMGVTVIFDGDSKPFFCATEHMRNNHVLVVAEPE